MRSDIVINNNIYRIYYRHDGKRTLLSEENRRKKYKCDGYVIIVQGTLYEFKKDEFDRMKEFTGMLFRTYYAGRESVQHSIREALDLDNIYREIQI